MAELALAIPGVLDVCIRSARKIKKTCNNFKNFDEEVEKATILVESILIRIEIQMRFLEKIAKLLDAELAVSQLNLLHILKGRLEQTILELEMPKTGKVEDHLRKWKWAIKDRLNRLASELEAWQNRFDPTWYLTILNSDQLLDNQLKKLCNKITNDSESRFTLPDNQINPVTNLWSLREASDPKLKKKFPVYLDSTSINDTQGTTISFSGARIVLRQESFDSLKRSIIETVTAPDGSHGPLNVRQIRADVESFARKFQQVHPETFHLLKCQGVIERPHVRATLELAYSMPANNALPASLRGLLLDKGLIVSLSSIVKLAKQLVRSVSFVHACGFVHKSIRPENVLVFPSEQSWLETSYLIGFNQFRHAEQQTELLGDTAWHRNLYRHPERQGPMVQKRYGMQHDIYSLGVCLLEIGLWQSFVQYPGLNPNAIPVPPLSSELQLTDQDFKTPHLAAKLRTKDRMVDITRRYLPAKMGEVYTEVVIACLTCLDEGNGLSLSSDQDDKDGIIIGARFIQHILFRIDDISL